MHRSSAGVFKGPPRIHSGSSSSWLSWCSDPPAHLLDTNDVPCAADARIVRQIVAHQRTHIVRIDAAIAQLNATLGKLQRERAETVGRMQVNASLVSQLRALPAEVLEQIFLWAVPEPGERHGAQAEWSRQLPWSLAQVCRRWRDIAYGFPNLWSCICVDLSNRPCTPALLLRQLELATNRPLHIHFYSTIGLDPGLQQLEILIEHCERWKLADFRVHTQAQVGLLHQVRGGRLPILRFLRLEARPEALQHLLHAHFRDSPLLRHLSISDPSPYLEYAWTHLTSLDLTASAHTVIHTLRQCPNLTECRLRPLAYTARLESAHLPRLRKLYSTDTQIFEHLTVPALTHLFLPHDCVPVVSALVQRSGCALEHLYTFEGCTPRAVRRILAVCPSVRTLGMQITSTWDVSDLLHRLTPNSSFFRPSSSSGTSADLVLAPNLTAIAIAVTGPLGTDEATLEDIFEMVETRSALSDSDNAKRRLAFFGLFLSSSSSTTTTTSKNENANENENANAGLVRLLTRLDLLSKSKRVYVHVEFEFEHSKWGGGRVPGVLDPEGWKDPVVYLPQ
ncbi:hypothetical protein C8F01DRAFT_1060671 [Mycena amicta]|nr:hypothetical protein C8F01DRAFT_1060671 [Mycena amicta]